MSEPRRDVNSPPEQILVVVLRLLIGLSAVTQAVQLVRLALDPHWTQAAWWLVNAVVALLCVSLLRLTRSGQARIAGLGLTSVLALLAVALLVADGADKPVWVLLACVYALLCVAVLPRRAAAVSISVTLGAVFAAVTLQTAGAYEPLLSAEAKRPTDLATSVGIAALLLLTAVVAHLIRSAASPVGSPLDSSAVVDLAPPARVRTGALTPREVEIVALVAEGKSNAAIASQLVLSERTVQSHVRNAMRKTDCANRTELAVVAYREGIVDVRHERPENQLVSPGCE